MVLTDLELEPALLALASDDPSSGAGALEAFPPGRRAGLERLAAFDVRPYARGRNHAGPDRAVSALSPYLRHGLVSLPEARDHALRAGRGAARKFVQELAWREYWRLVLDRRGREVYDDVEAPKHRHHRVPGLPDELARAQTGWSCVDEPLRELFATGYLHNHARMWVASATTHAWQRHHAAGAALFAEHLLDHDPASNGLSWQWVESSFSHRPYLYNRENVERYAPELCAGCPVGGEQVCPVQASYGELARRQLGPDREAPEAAGELGARYHAPPLEERPELQAPAGADEVVWLHASSLGSVDAALGQAPEAARVAVVLDAPHLRTQPHAAKKLRWLAASALETAGELREAGRDVALAVADPAQALVELGAGRVLATDEPDPWIRDSLDRLEAAGVEVARVAPARLAPSAAGVPDRSLGRFSRWWKRAEAEAMQPGPEQLGLPLEGASL